MSSINLAKSVGVFVLTFIFGLGSAYVFAFFTESSSSVAVKSPSIVKAVPASEVVLSMDDKSFTLPSVDENNPEAFDAEGMYTANELSDPGFSFVINNKNLAVDCDDKEFGDLVQPTGFVFVGDSSSATASGSKLEFEKLALKDGRIGFSTKNINGSSYEFAGKFKVKGNFYTLDPDATVVEGELITRKDGVVTDRKNITFTWSIDLTCVC